MTKFAVFGWITAIFFLFAYSFTQIDLGLTLTRLSFWQAIQTSFQQIGYFNRPLSTTLFLLIIFMLYTLYLVILNKVKKGNFTEKVIWRLIIFTAILLWFSYNAFSYDLFNYIMDAKMITFYGKNPYTHKALDFPGDPMLGFMHWTHRYYPYGPFWLLVTIPLSFLGFQKLLPTMILIKGLGVFGYLLCCWAIERVLKGIVPKRRILGLTIFAFNPLVIIEGLVSGHNDMLMMGLLMTSLYFILNKKYISAWIFFIFSVGIKFVTGFLLPVFIFLTISQIKKLKYSWSKIWLISLIIMSLTIFLAAKRTELQPWYLLYFLPFMALYIESREVFLLANSFCFGMLLHYAPFLYFGNWNSPVPQIKFFLKLFSLGIGVIFILLAKYKSRPILTLPFLKKPNS